MTEKNGLEKFQIQILDQKLSLRSDDGKDHVKEVEFLVNSKMKEIIGANKAISTANVAILTSLTLADELLKTKNKNKVNTKNWINQIEDLINEIEDLGESTSA